MREQSTQKLSHAYNLDEIAASVATMQATSTLEDVAKFVLQRDHANVDAKYVHFFHEKIPSRSMADSTTLQPLDEVISQRPTDGALYRTRAVTRMFKDDFLGAARDLTEALGVCRLYNAQHRERNAQTDLVTARDAAAMITEYRADRKIEEKDQPSSLESQLLFQRANVYSALACDQIEAALSFLQSENGTATPEESPKQAALRGMSETDKQARHNAIEARKMVRTYAKRALRDYLAFIAHFDYTPGLASDVTEAFLKQVNTVANGYKKRTRGERLLDLPEYRPKNPSTALVRHKGMSDAALEEGNLTMPSTQVHTLNTLFAAVPPSDLPPYPSESMALVPTKGAHNHASPQHPDFAEAVTYHPLLTDALHSLLLCHCMVQTSPKELLRHAHMVARLVRVCDGYPAFLAARSPSRADWIEVIRRANNWLGLGSSWEELCEPAPLPGQEEKKPETPEERLNRIKQEAIRDALADDRVHDEESFRAAVRAREARALREEDVDGSNGLDGEAPKRWAQEDGKEYPISTERADMIARWIKEAPAPGAAGEGRPKKSGKKARLRKDASDLSSANGLEQSVETLNMDEEAPLA